MKPFENIIGNDIIKDYLLRMVESNTVGNSLLFAGPSGIGKGLFAEELAAMLLCQDDSEGIRRRKINRGNHPDLCVYRTVGKVGMHSIDAMRVLGEEAQQSPYEAQWKVFILHDAERMLPASANALLKTFEEPALSSVIILLSSAPERLLPTILSRCRRVNFHSVEEQEIAMLLQQRYGKAEEEARAWAALSQGSVGRAVTLMERGVDTTRTLLLEVLSYNRFRNYQQLRDIAQKLSDAVDITKKRLEEQLLSQQDSEIVRQMPTSQKEAFNKEVEGALSARFLEDVDAILDVVMSWYRDLTLLYVKGDQEKLINKDSVDALEQALQRGFMIPLDDVQKIITDARLSVARFIPLNYCLESLFLKLNYL